MIELEGYWYDGQSSQRLTVVCQVSDDDVRLTGDQINQRYWRDECTLMPRVASAPAKLMFADGGLCELPQQAGLDELYRQFHRGGLHPLIHYVENHLYSIALIAVISLVFVGSFIIYGIPAMAKYAAERVPMSVEQETGDQVLAFIDKALCNSSELSQTRQSGLRSHMLDWTPEEQQNQIRIEFRHCERIGPNALALPSGIIVFTDQLIEIAEHDSEILGVFAHELGHVNERHSMRMLLQSSVMGLLAVIITGDVGSASSIAVTLPVVLVETGFSREFEREADKFAAAVMTGEGESPTRLADILTRMDEEYGQAGGVESFLSTHPVTSERVSYLHSFKINSAQVY